MVRHRRLINRHSPMIFAAKTTASGLIALLIAFTFNLDQPQWALLTVFIVSQAQQSGPVLAKSFYRVVGTLIGAAVALLLVALLRSGARPLPRGTGDVDRPLHLRLAIREKLRGLRVCPVRLHGGYRRHPRRPRARTTPSTLPPLASPKSASASSSPPRSTASSCQARRRRSLAVRGGGTPSASRSCRRAAGRRRCHEIDRAAGGQGNRDREPARVGNIRGPRASRPERFPSTVEPCAVASHRRRTVVGEQLAYFRHTDRHGSGPG